MSDVQRETLISIAINGAITLVFFAAIFGFRGPPPVHGVGALAFDFVPQSIMIALMGSLVPGLIARARSGTAAPGPAQVARRSLLVALAAGVVAGLGGWLFLEQWPNDTMPLAGALAMKLLFAGALAAIVTPAALRHVREASR